MNSSSTATLPSPSFHVHAPAPGSNATPHADILLIEDDEVIRNLLSYALRHRGYTVQAAANGRSALQLKNTHRFRLVVTDLFMPEMDGLEVIMEHHRSTPHVPLLAMTGGYHYSEPEDTLRIARVLGSDCTIAKPFELDDFLGTVARILGAPAGGETRSGG